MVSDVAYARSCLIPRLLNTSYKALVIPDVHVPFQDDLSLNALERYMADNRFDEVVYIGDLLDFAQISKFNQGSPLEESRNISDDYKIAKQILDRHISIIKKNNRKAKFTLLEGNHEDRIERWLAKNPQVKGLVEVNIGLKLGERGINRKSVLHSRTLHESVPCPEDGK